MTVFTLLAYKPNGVETHRNCVTDRWNSDFETLTTDDLSVVAERLGKLWFEHPSYSAFYGDPGCDYEITILFDGVGADEWPQWEEQDEENPLHERRQELSEQINTAAKAALQRHKDAKAAEEARAEAARKAGLASAAAARRRAEIKRLEERLSTDSIEADRARLRDLEAGLDA